MLLPADLWEKVTLPSRVLNLQNRWLDEAIGSGEWLWTARGKAGPGPEAVAFYSRGLLRQLPLPPIPESQSLGSEEQQILDYLNKRGASFVSDMAQDTGLTPRVVRASLWSLARRGLTTNDRFEVVRKGETEDAGASGSPSAGQRSYRRSPRASIHTPLAEGRWSVLPWGPAEVEKQAVNQATRLLNRYGVVARELALLDPTMLPWRVLYDVLSRMELSGIVRRGYLVEGLHGAQFALPEALNLLESVQTPSTATAPVILLHSLDPANLYGAGAPFDIPLLDGGTRSFSRRLGNWLTLRAGKPILLAEGQGKRLTALASASQEDVTEAVSCLPGILNGEPGHSGKHKLTVEEWNGQSVTATSGRELLEKAGFVRDYQAMTLYAAWQ
jgi:ATP-dependent Lhr-like helicase